MREVLSIIDHTAKYDSSVVVASAVAMQKATVQENVRAQETRIPLDLPQRTYDGYEGRQAPNRATIVSSVVARSH